MSIGAHSVDKRQTRASKLSPRVAPVDLTTAIISCVVIIAIALSATPELAWARDRQCENKQTAPPPAADADGSNAKTPPSEESKPGPSLGKVTPLKTKREQPQPPEKPESLGEIKPLTVKSEQQDQPSTAPTKNAETDALSIRRQLDNVCDTIRRSAVRGAYGWGWPSEIEPLPVEKGVSTRNRVQPDIDLRVTAAAGLLLELAGRELNSIGDREAAFMASRAIASVILPTGQVPPTARLVPTPAGHPERVGAIPSREATASTLALVLTVIEARKDQPDQRLTAAATRAATWLTRQQTSGGGWQFPYPPGGGIKAQRLIRLDGPEFRDDTYALMLASRVLGRREYGMAADRCIEQLLRLRIREETSLGAGLWHPTYQLGGDVVRDIEEFPYTIDMAASRYATETLLAAHLVAGRNNLIDELTTATVAMTDLRNLEGKWLPRYPVFARKKATPAPSDQANDTSDEKKDHDKEPKTPAVDEVAVFQLVAAVSSAHKQGADKYGRELWMSMGATERLAAATCHLADDMLNTQPRADQNIRKADLPAALVKAWDLLLQLKSEPRETKKNP